MTENIWGAFFATVVTVVLIAFFGWFVILVSTLHYNIVNYPQCSDLDRFQEERCHKYIDDARLKGINVSNSTTPSEKSRGDNMAMDYYYNPGYRHMPGNYWNNINRGGGVGYP